MAGFFVQRLLTFTFGLGTGDYGAGTPNKFSLTAASGALAGSNAALQGASAAPPGNVLAQPLRALVHIEFASLPATGAAQIRIWGMSLDHMNVLSRAGLVFGSRQNTVTVQAGDASAGMATVFTGLIIEAYPDMNGQPDPSFYIFATPTNTMQLKPVAPTTYPGAASADTVLGTLAATAGLKLENNGVSGVLQSPYFPGTAWQQIRRAVTSLNCFGVVDGVTNTLAVWPKNGSRAGQANVISPETGMIGYPSFQYVLVKVKQLFNPSNLPQVGKQVQVKSQLQAATGTFTLVDVTMELSCNLPDGPWETDMTLTPPGNQ